LEDSEAQDSVPHTRNEADDRGVWGLQLRCWLSCFVWYNMSWNLRWLGQQCSNSRPHVYLVVVSSTRKCSFELFKLLVCLFATPVSMFSLNL
jgi:hypothetical protein